MVFDTPPKDGSSKWDARFLALATHIAQWSKDPSTKVGAVIVRPDKTICSVGFNGFPAGMEDKTEWYEDRNEKYPRTIHAEMNALLFARERVKGYTLYTWPLAPCADRCAVHLIQAGIARFVFPGVPNNAKARWEESTNRTKSYLKDMRITFEEVSCGKL